ncbi:MAG TPA: serine hydrolase domain-containing protein [Thermoanaerobaculia bacterium]|nr:serine hydrolase domain-containing protein [Thermoanaerobaculia bacterium]
MPGILGFVIGAILATIPFRSPAVAPDPISATDAVSGQIERLIEPQSRADLFSGAILVQRGDRAVFQRAYGFASWELRVANSEHTRFGIGSITKPMTDALVSLLVKQNRLNPRARVEQYIPGFPRGPGGGQPTIDQLLKHTAGVPHRVTTPAEEMLPLHPADIVERVKARGLLFEPGSRELYSSAGYTCLARVIEVIEGRPFDDALAESVFKPAQMNFAVGETGPRLMPDRALPFVLRAGRVGPAVEAAPYKDLRFLAGAGSVYATPADLVAFARKARDGGLGEELQSWINAGGKDKWRGWYGRVNGYEASLDLLPSQDLVVVLLSNLQSAANWQLRQRIHDLLLGRPVLAIPMPPARAAGFEPSSDLVGLYGDLDDPVEVAVHEGEIYRDENQIYPIAGDRYYIPVSGNTMRFHRQEGKVDSIVTTLPDGSERVLRKLATR